MAGILTTASTAEIALAANTEKLIMSVASTSNNDRMKLLRWGIFFDSITSNAEPVIVQIKVTTGTIGGTTTLTAYKITPGSETPAMAFSISNGANTLTGSVADSAEVHPQSGYEIIYPMGQEIIIPGGSDLMLTANAPAIVNAKGKMTIEI